VTSSRPRTVVRKSKILRSTRYWPLLGYYQYQSVTSPARWREYTEDSDDQRDHGEEAIQWKFTPAAWLSSQVFSMQKLKSYGNWQYTFKSVRVLPYEHSVFDACQRGSINAIILALKEGTASLNDVDDNGWTLLHVCMNSDTYGFFSSRAPRSFLHYAITGTDTFNALARCMAR
jgi:hypothetical protein